MEKCWILRVGGAMLGVALLIGTVRAQHAQTPASQPSHDHMGGAAAGPPGVPSLSGQDAFGAIQEIVHLLEADPATDWAKVNLERLRQHLIDMNEVVLRSEVRSVPVPGGLAMEVTGAGRTQQAIRAMVIPHAAELDALPAWSAKAERIPGGVRLTVKAKDPNGATTIARIRGLGFIGLLIEGAHHQPHHLAMAKGEEIQGHAH
jgi:hypothetical protein